MDTPLRAIRAKCLDCCCGFANEVKLCTAEKCPLHPFRFGKNPNRAGIGNHNAVAPNSTSDSSENPTAEGIYTTGTRNTVESHSSHA